MKKTKFTIRKDNEWFEIPQLLCCCDCGLVHNIDFKVILKAKRNIKETKLRRKHEQKETKTKR